MFRVHVDISLFTRNEAFGRIAGPLDVAVIPQIGDHMSFWPPEGMEERDDIDLPPGPMKVTGRIISAHPGDEIGVSLVLDDVTVETRDDARKVMRFFELCHGLFGEPFGAEG